MKLDPSIAIKTIQNAQAGKSVMQLANVVKDMGFGNVYQEAVAAMQFAQDQTQFKIQKNQVQKKQAITEIEFAQAPGAVQGVGLPAIAGQPETLNRVPIQLFLDRAVFALENLSRQEFQVNNLIEEYVEGNLSEDEVFVATAKLNLSMTMITTIIQTAVQTFKELQNTPL